MDIEIKLSLEDDEGTSKALEEMSQKGFDYDLNKTETSFKEIIIRGSFSGEVSELIKAISKNIKIKQKL